MYRRINCRKYWKWKRQQESRSKESEKKKKKKRKPKESMVDCIDSVEQNVPTEMVFKAPRSCKQKKKKKKKIRSLFGLTLKRISIAELVLKSIKPSMEIRACILNPRHVSCLRTETADITPEFIESAISILNQTRKVDRMDSLEKIKLGLKPKPKENLRKRRDICPKKKKTKDEESDSDEDSDCKSICSIDSTICLAGTKLTPKDKKEIKKYQQEQNKKDDDS